MSSAKKHDPETGPLLIDPAFPPHPAPFIDPAFPPPPVRDRPGDIRGTRYAELRVSLENKMKALARSGKRSRGRDRDLER